MSRSFSADVPLDGKHDAILYVGDASQDPTTGVEGALGHHSENHKDIPYGFVTDQQFAARAKMKLARRNTRRAARLESDK